MVILYPISNTVVISIDSDELDLFYGAKAAEIAKDRMDWDLHTDEVGGEETKSSVHLSSSDEENDIAERPRVKGRPSLNDIPKPNFDDMSTE